MRHTNIKHTILIFILLLFFGSCKRYLDIPPAPNTVVGDLVFTSEEKASSALMGLYANMANNGSQFSNWLITAYAGIYSDELLKFGPIPTEEEFQNNQLLADNSQVQAIWLSIYQNIYMANQIIEGLTKSNSITVPVKNQLLGEAKFIRAFCYFYITNLYGDVPKVITTNYVENAVLSRSPIKDIYGLMVTDLEEARNLLSSSYPVPGTKIRPNKFAVSGLLARVYLYEKNWSKAEAMATEVISSDLYTPLTTLGEVFLQNSKEALWQLGQTSVFPREFSSAFRAIGVPRYYLSPEIIGAFDAGDERRLQWVDSIQVSSDYYFYPGKYKAIPFSQFYMMLRISEQYLIRAEARAQQTNLNGAIEDLNIIRNRASLPDLITSLNLQQTLDAVAKERKLEFFGEWGHRWFDLKRTNKSNEILGPLKSNWQPTDTLWPIPKNEILANIKLVQNQGY